MSDDVRVTGADVSEWQGGILPAGDFILIRATTGYRDDLLFAQNWAGARGFYPHGRGVYCYLVPDRDPMAQAQRMIALVADDPPELGYWIDIEQAGLTHDQALAAIDTVRATGHPGFYANVYDYEGILRSDPALDDVPWWVAQYGANDGHEHPVDDPPAPRPYLIHQYTSLGGPGGTGLDLNSASSAALDATFRPPPPPPPPEGDPMDYFSPPIKTADGTTRIIACRADGVWELRMDAHGAPIAQPGPPEWHGWGHLGGHPTSSIEFEVEANVVRVYVRGPAHDANTGSNYALFRRTWDGATWDSNWVCLWGILDGPPAT